MVVSKCFSGVVKYNIVHVAMLFCCAYDVMTNWITGSYNPLNHTKWYCIAQENNISELFAMTESGLITTDDRAPWTAFKASNYCFFFFFITNLGSKLDLWIFPHDEE